MGNALGAASAHRVAFDCVAQGRAGDVRLARLLNADQLSDDDRRALLRARDAYGRTLLLCACLHGNVRAAQLLLDRGASTAVRAHNGWTPLHYACALKRDDRAADLISLLLAHCADPLVRDSMGQTPAHVAQFNARVVALRHLESKMCDFVGGLKMEVASGAMARLGGERTGWRSRWVAITRLRGSRAMARAPPLRCPRCLRDQPRDKFDADAQRRAYVTCVCRQVLIVPARPRDACDALAVYADNNAAAPEAVFTLSGCTAEVLLENGMSVLAVRLAPDAERYVDPVYLSRKGAALHRLLRARQRLCAREKGLLRLGSTDADVIRLVHATMSRGMRTVPEPGALGEAGFARVPSLTAQARAGSRRSEVPMAVAVDEAEDEDDEPAVVAQRGLRSGKSTETQQQQQQQPAEEAGEQDDDAAEEPSAPPLPAKPRAREEGRKRDWKCAHCSLENPGKFENCQMCRRPPDPAAAAPTAAPVPPSAPAPHEVSDLELLRATRASIRDAAELRGAEGAFVCPITDEVMCDPVFTSDGQTYERAAIEAWFAKGNATAPLSGAPLSSAHLVPNIALRHAIEQFVAAGRAPEPAPKPAAVQQEEERPVHTIDT